MRKKLKFMMACFFLVSSLPALASHSLEADYFTALEQIQKPPLGSSAMLAYTIEDKKRFFDLVPKSHLKNLEGLKLTDGNLYDRWGEAIKIYKGDFSNEGMLEYAVISTGGTLHANTVTMYKLIEGHLVNINFDQVVVKNLIPGGDMSRFYLQIADPFAIQQDGKTYLRFMRYPSGRMNYDKTSLRLCTYFWKGKRFSLVGPNWKFTNAMVSAKDCIGS